MVDSTSPDDIIAGRVARGIICSFICLLSQAITVGGREGGRDRWIVILPNYYNLYRFHRF